MRIHGATANVEAEGRNHIRRVGLLKAVCDALLAEARLAARAGVRRPAGEVLRSEVA